MTETNGERGPRENRIGLEWSPSTGSALEYCAYQVYLGKIVSFGGWGSRERASTLSRQAYLLSKLQGAKAWAGTIVHDTIESFLRECQKQPERSEALLTFNLMIDRARLEFDREWQASLVDRVRTFPRCPKKETRLQEHYFGDTCSRDDLWKLVARCIRRFVDEVVPRVLRIPVSQWLEIEEFNERTGEIAHFMRTLPDGQEIKIFSVLDFSYRDDEGRFYLVDWKSGRRSEFTEKKHELQLAVYLLYAMQRWGAKPEDVVMQVAYLADTEELSCIAEYQGRNVQLEKLNPEIDRQIMDLRSRLQRADDGSVKPDLFPTTDAKGKCQSCQFRPLCPRARELRIPGYDLRVRTEW